MKAKKLKLKLISLKNNGNKTNILPMVDVSGSMLAEVSGSTTAMDVSISLGMYLSQRNDSAFKNVLCSFAERPKLFNLENNVK